MRAQTSRAHVNNYKVFSLISRAIAPAGAIASVFALLVAPSVASAQDEPADSEEVETAAAEPAQEPGASTESSVESAPAESGADEAAPSEAAGDEAPADSEEPVDYAEPAYEEPVAQAEASSSDSPKGFQLELGLFGGWSFWGLDLELGVDDNPGAVSSPDFGPIFGGRIAGNVLPWFSLEFEGALSPTKDRFDDENVLIGVYRAHALFHLFDAPISSYRLRPFVLGGVSIAQVLSTDGGPGVGIEYKDVDAGFHVGFGTKFDLNKSWLLRFDTRIMWLPNFREGEVTANWEFLLGLGYKIGPAAPPPPPPPAEPIDSDGDGLVDPEDGCPDAAEDVDGFEDEDGCPESDNDEDGVADEHDSCPLEPELVNGIDDEDGCPETDDDGDGFLGSADGCPAQAEDVDGFEDEDGCPDPDNDGDGVLDADDKCEGELETPNGYEDEDGCADEVPKAVKRFTGVIKGIKFKKGSDAVQRKSFRVLKAAVKVLKEYPALRLLVEGHTSSEGKAAVNLDLSNRRAIAVKEYLVSAGVESERIETQGFGADRPIAPNATRNGRRQNRRIEFRLLRTGEHAGETPQPTPEAPAVDGDDAGADSTPSETP